MRAIAIEILEGKRPAPNPYLGFVANQCKGLKQEGEVILERLQKMRKEGERLERRLVEINGALSHHADVVTAWLGQEELKKQEKEMSDDGGDEKQTE